MIEPVLNDSEDSSDDNFENQEVQEKKKQVFKSEKEKKVFLLNKKSKQPIQRPLAKDFFDIDVFEDSSPVPAKKSKNFNQSKMVHPISAVPGQTWNNQLSAYKIKKLNNLPSSKDVQICKNGKEDRKVVHVATLEDSKRNKANCKMEFLTKKVPEKRPILNSSFYPVDDQRMTDFHSPASTSFDWPLPDYHEQRKSVFSRKLISISKTFHFIFL